MLRAGKSGSAAAADRELALRRLLVDGPKTGDVLRAAIPTPKGFTPKQHAQSIGNALTRLRIRGVVTRGADGWVLTAKGRKAAPAAKEEP